MGARLHASDDVGFVAETYDNTEDVFAKESGGYDNDYYPLSTAERQVMR